MTFAVPRSMQVLDLQANKFSQLLPSLTQLRRCHALEMSGNEALRNSLGPHSAGQLPLVGLVTLLPELRVLDIDGSRGAVRGDAVAFAASLESLQTVQASRPGLLLLATKALAGERAGVRAAVQAAGRLELDVHVAKCAVLGQQPLPQRLGLEDGAELWWRAPIS